MLPATCFGSLIGGGILAKLVDGTFRKHAEKQGENDH
jgi:hypothetical protein